MTVAIAGVDLAGIPGDVAVQGGAVALLGVVAWLVFTGRLVPRRVLQDVQQDRDYWREAALKAQGHTDQLLPAAQITTEVVQALSDQTSAAIERGLAGRGDQR